MSQRIGNICLLVIISLIFNYKNIYSDKCIFRKSHKTNSKHSLIFNTMITLLAPNTQIIKTLQVESPPINSSPSPKYCYTNQSMSHTSITSTKALIIHSIIKIISIQPVEVITRRFLLKSLKTPSPNF